MRNSPCRGEVLRLASTDAPDQSAENTSNSVCFTNAHSRDSMLMPMDDRQLNLMLVRAIQLIRCEPTTHFNAAGTYCTGNGVLHDGS